MIAARLTLAPTRYSGYWLSPFSFPTHTSHTTTFAVLAVSNDKNPFARTKRGFLFHSLQR